MGTSSWDINIILVVCCRRFSTKLTMYYISYNTVGLETTGCGYEHMYVEIKAQ